MFKEKLDLNYIKKQNRLFKKFDSQINEENANKLKLIVIYGIILNLILFLYFIIFNKKVNFPGYFIFLINVFLNMAFYVCINYFIDKKDNIVTFLCYTYFYAFLIAFSIIEINFNPNSNASAIWGVYVLYSFVIMDKTKRFSLLNLIFAFYFCWSSLHLKNINIAVLDCINCCLFYIITCIVQIYFTKERLHKLILIEEISRQRDTDYLTKLANRNATENNIDEYLLENKNKINCLLIMDLDNFKTANDTYGHDYGDRVLKDVAKKMRNVFNAGSSLCRIGGDEFLIFCPDLYEEKEAITFAKNLKKEIKKIALDGHHVVGCSIGLSYSDVNDTYHTLFLKADKALYDAKKQGKNCIKIYEEN